MADGVIELPRAVLMAGYTTLRRGRDVMLDWYVYGADARPCGATTYQNVSDGWRCRSTKLA